MTPPILNKKNWADESWRENKKKQFITKKRGNWHGKREFKLFEKFPKKNIAIAAVLFLAFMFLSGAIAIAWIGRDLPDPNKLMDRKVAQSTKIYDRTGKTVLYEISGDEKRTIVGLNEIPDYVKQSTIVIEDKDFYKHGGFSFLAILRTAATNILFGKKAGGSTLTQQFVKNAILTTEKTYTRKIKELLLAYRLEKKFSKDEILQMYFNEIPYGSTAYGIEAASQKYFGKSVRDINLPEASILAALPQAPSRYSPYGTHKDELMARQRYIIDLMAKYGHISEDQAFVYKNFPVKFKEQTDNIQAPHFVMYVKELLSDKYGEKEIEQNGLKIITTLDLYKQKVAEDAIKEQAEKNEKSYNASNAAIISIDPKTGQVLAMVGSKDYFNEKIDGQVNITTSPRQPGSSIKPIVYAAAFLKGYSPNTVLYDVITNFSTNPANPYEPHNYNGKEYGPVTIRKALAGSLNVPAVKAMYLAGLDSVVALAKNLGYTSLDDKNRLGLSLVLGGGEVKLIEHTNAYSAFARDGYIAPISTILRIEDKNGKVLEEYNKKPIKALEPNAARMITDIITDNASRSYIFGAKNWLVLDNRPVGVKTGTTNNNRDAWTIGFTPSLVTGVWVGNNNNTPMKAGADGSVVAAPIWNKYMKTVLGDTPVESFKKPTIVLTGKPVLDGDTGGETTVKIDRASGLLASSNTPESFIEEKTYKQIHSILYYVSKNDPLGSQPKNPADDPQYYLWESRIQSWAVKNNISSSSPPTTYDNLHILENLPILSITSPSDKEIISSENLTANITASSPRGISRAEYYIDNNLAYTNSNYPFNLERNISFLKNGFHALTVKVCDDIDNCATQSLEFNLLLSGEKQAGDISLSWVEPTADMTISTSSFPLLLKVLTSNAEQTAKIIFYHSDKINAKKIKIIAPINNPIEEALWEKALPGVYTIYAEASGWNAQTAKSPVLTITVK